MSPRHGEGRPRQEPAHTDTLNRELRVAPPTDSAGEPDLLSFIVSRATDSDTAAILDLVHGDDLHRRDRAEVVSTILRVGRTNAGVVDADRVREQLPPFIYPRVIGPCYRALTCAGVLEMDGWKISEDRRGRNSGRPQRRYRIARRWAG